MKKETSLKGLYAGGAILTGTFAIGVAMLTNVVLKNMPANVINKNDANTTMSINGSNYIADDSVGSQYSIAYTDANIPVSEQTTSDVSAEVPVIESPIDEYSIEDSTEDSAENFTEEINQDDSSQTQPEDENTFTECDHEHMEVDSTGDGIYYVKKGDTLSYVSSLVGYSVDELADYNEIHDVNIIRAGSALRVPLNATCKCTVLQ